MDYIDLTGKKFGRLTAIEIVGKSNSGGVPWKCKCDCGNETIVSSGHLMNGHTKSCGCFRKDLCKSKGIKNKKYGKRIREIRYSMIRRCYAISDSSYGNYGARGITVCDEWRDEKNGLYNFYNWAICNGYSDELSIDRIDYDGPYSPENCRWSTNIEQANNKRNNRILEYNGERHSVSEWSRITGICKVTIQKRAEWGWPVEDILKKEDRRKNKRNKYNVESVENLNLLGEVIPDES